MTPAERLRQLHTGSVWRRWPNASFTEDAEISALVAAFPQLANLAEAAARAADDSDQIPAVSDYLTRALADLEQALNPTGNTQSQA